MKRLVIFVAFILSVTMTATARDDSTNRVTLTAKVIIVDWTPRVETGLVCLVEWREIAATTNTMKAITVGTATVVEMKPKGQTRNVVVTLEASPEFVQKAKTMRNKVGEFTLWGKGYGAWKEK